MRFHHARQSELEACRRALQLPKAKRGPKQCILGRSPSVRRDLAIGISTYAFLVYISYMTLVANNPVPFTSTLVALCLTVLPITLGRSERENLSDFLASASWRRSNPASRRRWLLRRLHYWFQVFCLYVRAFPQQMADLFLPFLYLFF